MYRVVTYKRLITDDRKLENYQPRKVAAGTLRRLLFTRGLNCKTLIGVLDKQSLMGCGCL